MLKIFTKTLDLCGLVTWGASCFLGEFYFFFEGRPRPLLDSLRFGLLNEEFIGFTFVSVVSFPSCYYICIVGVVRVRTIHIFFGKATINVLEQMLAGDHSVLSSAVFTPKRVEDGCMVVAAKIFFEFLLNQALHTLQKGSNCKH